VPDDVRSTLDAAYLELSQETGASVTALHDAAAELSGHDAGSAFGSQAEEINALAALANGIRDGSLAAGRLTEADAQREHERIEAAYTRQPWEPGYDPSMPRLDPRKVSAPSYFPQPVTPSPVQRQPARLTEEQEAEVNRLLPLSNSMQRGEPQRPSYGSATGGPAASELRLSNGLPPADTIRPLELSPRSQKVIDAFVGLAQRTHADDPAEVALSGEPGTPVKPADVAALTADQVTAKIAAGELALTRRADGHLILAEPAPAGRPAAGPLSPAAHRELRTLRDAGLGHESRVTHHHVNTARACCDAGDHDGAVYHYATARKIAAQANDAFPGSASSLLADLEAAAQAEAAGHGGREDQLGPQVYAHEVPWTDDPTDRDQPGQGGRPDRRGLAAILADNPDLFGPSPDASGNYTLRPKSPAQRARERRASRPGHTSGA
jgi:hypothetical protein